MQVEREVATGSVTNKERKVVNEAERTVRVFFPHNIEAKNELTGVNSETDYERKEVISVTKTPLTIKQKAR